jgi:hypothetical protein
MLHRTYRFRRIGLCWFKQQEEKWKRLGSAPSIGACMSMAYAPSTFAPHDLAATAKPAPAKRNVFLRLADAIERANMRRAEREIARYLGAHGAKFTDESEREIEQRFLGGR